MTGAREIFVYFGDELMGVLSVLQSRGKEVFSFAYDSLYLRTHPQQNLDPDLNLYAGAQYTLKPNFGLFMDSAPDRWGRRLMQRREAMRAREAGERPHALLEADYLLGVYDLTRMGALRFKISPDGAYLNDDSALSAPPWARLRELEEAARHVESDEPSTTRDKWLSLLLAPGSSLGGARPKASVTAPNGSLWIAKFPSRADEVDTAAWEYVTMRMANAVGLRTPPVRLEKFSKYGSTFLTQRFDRDGNRRIHFASAMTLLGRTDGTDASDGVNYLDLAELICRHGAEPTDDLRELWRRIVFSIAVRNTDDHLRNHGFLLTEKGWRLSPLYDVNPNPEGHGLSLNITEYENALDFDLAREVADVFRVMRPQADDFIAHVRETVAHWRDYAHQAKITRINESPFHTLFAEL